MTVLFVVDQVAGAEYILPLIRQWQGKSSPRWRIVASAVSSAFLTPHEIAHETLSLVDQRNVMAFLNRDIFDQALVSTSASNSKLEREFVLALRRKNIPCCQIIDAWVNYGIRFEYSDANEPAKRLYPDKILTLDDQAKRDMVNEGIPADLIEIIGQPYFEYQARLNRRELRRASPLSTLLVTQPISKHFGAKLGYDEISFTRTCLAAWQAAGHRWPEISIAVHPAENAAAYKKLASEYSDEISVFSNKTLNLRRDFALVLGMYSSVLVQAILAEVPCASVQVGRKGEDMCFLSRYGIIPRLESTESLAQFLSQPRKFSALAGNDGKLHRSLQGSCERLEAFLIKSGKR